MYLSEGQGDNNVLQSFVKLSLTAILCADIIGVEGIIYGHPKYHITVDL